MAEDDSDNRPSTPNPTEKLVRVFDTEQESEALVVQGLLETSGIDSDITALDAPQDILPGVGGTLLWSGRKTPLKPAGLSRSTDGRHRSTKRRKRI